MGDVLHITEQAELEKTLDYFPKVVIDFTAPAWCVPCQKFAPHYEAAARQADGVVFVAVDVDKAPWAMEDYGVQSVPTVMLYEDGKYVKNVLERTVIKLLGEIA